MAFQGVPGRGEPSDGPPGAAAAVPCRHLRAPAGLVDPQDLQAAADIVAAALRTLWAGGA
jgi:putative aminopeptidase FrvX